MKVLFIEGPPSLDWKPGNKISTAGRRHPSLNVTGERVYCYLNLSAAAVLREAGHEAKYIHCQTENKTVNDLKKEIPRIDPDVTVFYVEHINISTTNEIARIVKQNTNSKVVFVGALPTAIDKELIKLNTDFVLRREWDYSLCNLVNVLEKRKKLSGVRGLTYKIGKRIKRNKDAEFIKDLDKLPIPAYDLVDHTKFYEVVFKRLPAATAISSRGCPYNCIFCVFPNTIYSHKWRAQSPERVLEEARYLHDILGIKEIRYDDDTFEIDKKRVLEICKLFRQEKLDLLWAPQSRPNLITKNLAKEMKRAGCTRILYGVESGDNEILKKIRKSTTRRELRQGVKNAQEAEIDVLNCIMIGFLWDTKETIKKTIKFAFDLNAEFTQFSIATPLPGTDYYEILKQRGYIVSKNLENADSFHHANVNFPQISSDEIDELLKNIYRRYYTRFRYMFMMGKRMFRSLDDFNQTLRLMKAYWDRYREGWL